MNLEIPTTDTYAVTPGILARNSLAKRMYYSSARLGPFFPGGSAYGDLRSLQGLGDGGDFCSSPCPPNCPDDYDPSACSPVNASVCQPTTNDYSEMYGTPQCVAALGPIVASENPLWAALEAKISSLTGPTLELQSDPGWANAFAQLGITQQEALCFMSMQRCSFPGVAAWLASQGYTEASQTPASPATNFTTLQPNSTTGVVINGTAVNAQTGQPINQAQASAASGQGNQSVPPQSQILPMSTGISQTGASMAAGAQPAPAPTATSSPCSIALFGETSCIGPVGTTTALVIAAGIAALFFMGGKR